MARQTEDSDDEVESGGRVKWESETRTKTGWMQLLRRGKCVVRESRTRRSRQCASYAKRLARISYAKNAWQMHSRSSSTWWLVSVRLCTFWALVFAWLLNVRSYHMDSVAFVPPPPSPMMQCCVPFCICLHAQRTSFVLAFSAVRLRFLCSRCSALRLIPIWLVAGATAVQIYTVHVCIVLKRAATRCNAGHNSHSYENVVFLLNTKTLHTRVVTRTWRFSHFCIRSRAIMCSIRNERLRQPRTEMIFEYNFARSHAIRHFSTFRSSSEKQRKYLSAFSCG